MTENPELKAARRHMYKYCAYQDRCRHELLEKLREYGLSDLEKEDLLAHLRAERFWDEERYVRAFVRGKFYHKDWGRIKIRHGLWTKKIERSLVDRILAEEVSEEQYEATLEKLVRKKQKQWQKEDGFKRKSKIIRFLSSKGFEKGIILDFWGRNLS